jgi:hypothetical protein
VISIMIIIKGAVSEGLSEYEYKKE